MQHDTRPPARVELDIGHDSSTLLVAGAGIEPSRTLIAIGQANVRPGPFASEPPRALELEAAIEIVEEQLMPLVRAVPRPAELSTTASGVDLHAAIAAALGRAPSVPVRIDEVEAAFSHLASLAVGMPPRGDDLLRHAGAAAALLILREWMHHAGFDAVRLG